ncbi:LysR family transcriptional regulator [Flavonifractor plautii]|nr:LysR family transcriptional regulator [Flavonifractor plautii]
MTIAQMSHFYALCQSGSYTQAAKQLYITQPALSKSIAALESELNLRLVERSTRTVALTAAGEEFARACEEMLEVYRKGVNNARTAAGDISGLVRFGLPRDRVCDTFARACGGISRRNTPTSGWSCAFTAKTDFSAPWTTTWQTSSWLSVKPPGGQRGAAEPVRQPDLRRAARRPPPGWGGRAELLSTAA